MWVLQLCGYPAAPHSLLGLVLVQNSTPGSHRHAEAWVPMCVPRSLGWAQAARGDPQEDCDAAGQLLAVPHQALPHVLFLHVCLPGKKDSRSLLHFFSSWPISWLKTPQANAWLLLHLAGSHLPPQWYQSAGKHPFRQFETVPSHVQFSSTKVWWLLDVWVCGVFYHCNQWFHLFESFKRFTGLVASDNQKFEKGFETRYIIFVFLKWETLTKLFKDIPEGEREKGTSDCYLIQGYRWDRAQLFSEVRNKGSRSNSYKLQ